MKIDLTGKNILVTGASRGIGRAIAETLAESGARVAAHYHTGEAEAKALAEKIGNGAKIFKADLALAEECENLFSEVIKDFGSIDVLVNNAGTMAMAGMEEDDWTKKWDKTMAINLRSAGILSRRVVLHFKKQGGGRIINIASRAAFRGDTPEFLAYAASKGGMVSLSRSIARDFGKDGVKSFIIAPGWVRTEATNESIKEYGEENIVGDIALNRLTEPRDIAPLVAFLASGLADHATGGTFDVNAGSYVH
ncbi:MAG: SDR family oxidoreductase [Patescibacteria group bacterium]|jgi:NAD(P)-dependent dehydrogenase (short-subunit alcohol dehydrogenase family)